MVAYANRESFDIASMNLPHHAVDSTFSPAPTYSSRFHSPRPRPSSHDTDHHYPPNQGFTWKLFSWPGTQEENPLPKPTKFPYHQDQHEDYYHQPTTPTTKATEMSDFNISNEPHDPLHPHYIAPPPAPTQDHEDLPPRPHPKPRPLWHQKRILIPWTLFLTFFLITLWFASIALGARFLSVIHPYPKPAPMAVNVYMVDGEIMSVKTTILSGGIPTATPTSTPTTVGSDNKNPATTQKQALPTGELDTAPRPGGDLDNTGDDQGPTGVLAKRRVRVAPTSFVTVVVRGPAI